mgnify:CR=1 FL=1
MIFAAGLLVCNEIRRVETQLRMYDEYQNSKPRIKATSKLVFVSNLYYVYEHRDEQN